MLNISKVNQYLTTIETSFNKLGGIPIVCIPSGALRAGAFKILGIVGCGMIITGGVGQIFGKESDKHKWERVAAAGAEYIIHSLFNMTMGTAEVIMGITTLGIGNVILLLANLSSQNGFKPWIAYGVFIEEDPQPQGSC